MSLTGRGHQRRAAGRLWVRVSKFWVMSSRLDRSWSVLSSHQTFDASRCVDVFARPNGTFGFEEFRRDREDVGVWTPVSYFSAHEYSSESDVLKAARRLVPWLGSGPRSLISSKGRVTNPSRIDQSLVK